MMHYGITVEKIWETWSGGITYDGYRYQSQGKVAQVKTLGSDLMAVVTDSSGTANEVNIQLEDAFEDCFHCTCEAVHHPCKHIIATLFDYAKGSTHNSGRNLDEMIDQADVETLREFLKEEVELDDDLLESLEFTLMKPTKHSIKNGINPPDLALVESKIIEAINSFMIDDCDWWDDGEMSEEMLLEDDDESTLSSTTGKELHFEGEVIQYIELAQAYINVNAVKEGIDILTVITDELLDQVEQFEYLKESDGSIWAFFLFLEGIWMEAALKFEGNEIEKTTILNRLATYSKNEFVPFFEPVFQALSMGWDHPYLKAVMGGKALPDHELDQMAVLGNAAFEILFSQERYEDALKFAIALERWECYADTMIHLNRHEEAVATLLENEVPLPILFVMTMSLVDKGLLVEAIDLTKKVLALLQEQDIIDPVFCRIYCELATRLKDQDMICEAHLLLFTGEPTWDHYSLIKNMPGMNWEIQRGNIGIRLLDEEKPTEETVDILTEEGLFDLAIQVGDTMFKEKVLPAPSTVAIESLRRLIAHDAQWVYDHSMTVATEYLKMNFFDEGCQWLELAKEATNGDKSMMVAWDQKMQDLLKMYKTNTNIMPNLLELANAEPVLT